MPDFDPSERFTDTPAFFPVEVEEEVEEEDEERTPTPGELAAHLARRTVDVDGDGAHVVIVKRGKWTGNDADLVELLNQRARTIAGSDIYLAEDARKFLGLR